MRLSKLNFLHKCRDRTLELLDNVSAERELNAYGNYNPFFIYLSFQVTNLPLIVTKNFFTHLTPSLVFYAL